MVDRRGPAETVSGSRSAVMRRRPWGRIGGLVRSTRLSEPVEIAGKRYVDGGAYSMVSLDLLAGQGLDLVIASAPLSTAD